MRSTSPALALHCRVPTAGFSPHSSWPPGFLALEERGSLSLLGSFPLVTPEGEEGIKDLWKSDVKPEVPSRIVVWLGEAEATFAEEWVTREWPSWPTEVGTGTALRVRLLPFWHAHFQRPLMPSSPSPKATSLPSGVSCLVLAEGEAPRPR